MSTSDAANYLNVSEAAKRLGVHENTVRKFVRNGQLQSSKVPGLRGHRFDVREVERLEQRRGDAVASIAPAVTLIGPELVDATQLDLWGQTRDAQAGFPELVRRLLTATPGVTSISVRAGDGVNLEGWDGIAESAGSSYLPKGSLALEFGTGKSAMKTKADDDYGHRTTDPLGLDPSRTVFVFATPRRWSRKAPWVTARRGEKVFADVVALDADDIESWLQSTPDVHQWISERLGRRPQDVETLARWWSRFENRTSTSLPSSLFLAGRSAEREQLLEILAGPARHIVVAAPWRDEALAFVAAATEGAEQDRSILLISSAEVWERTVSGQAGMTLVPLFEDPDLASAEKRGHHVILPVGRDHVVRGDAIKLPPPGRMESAEALESAGIPHDRAYNLAALARRSMPSLVRALSKDPSFTRPPWSAPPAVEVLAPLSLAGQWRTVPGDVELIERLVGRPWDEIERVLNRWSATDDPPFIHTGGQWHAAWPEEAFLVLRESITTRDVEQWQAETLKVFAELDPRLDLSAEDRPMAAVLGVQHPYSAVLRTGLAESLAILGASGEEKLPSGRAGEDVARSVVRELMRRANDDSSGGVWASLSDFLPLFAEASPSAFLDAVHEDLDRDEPVLRSIFRDRKDESAWLSDSPHTGLLWALERLAWSPEYLLEATQALAALAAIDPGGRLGNRPSGSLADILVGWIRHTSAGAALRSEAVNRICNTYPAIGWDLVLRLWPSLHGTSSPPDTPRFRDWLPDGRRVPITEWVAFVGELVSCALDLTRDDPARWTGLVTRLGPLPPQESDRVISELEQLADADALGDKERLEVWEALNREVSRHRRFASTDWAMGEDILGRLDNLSAKLEPGVSEQFAYLFDWRPDLPGIELDDHAAYDARVAELRADAVRTTWNRDGALGLQRLAERTAVPRHLGASVAVALSDDGDVEKAMFVLLDSEDEKLQMLAAGWANRRQWDEPVTWFLAQVGKSELASPVRQAALALEGPAGSALWDALETLDPEVKRRYWEHVYPFHAAPDDLPRATHELLAHGRPWTALDLLATQRHRPEAERQALTTDLVEKVLTATLTSDAREENIQISGYEVAGLLNFLDEAGVPADVLVKYEFPFLQLTEDHRQPKALYASLDRDPNLFVDLVKRVYRGKNDAPREPDERARVVGKLAWDVLHNWRTVPGLREDGSIDRDHFIWWITEARLALAEADRSDIGDEQIGELLSGGSTGEDGIWPAEPVRDLIETLGNERIETGLYIGRRNARGGTSRGVFEGGAQERVLAAQYHEHARQLSSQWRRTSRVLRQIGDSYEADARREDEEAGVRSDT